MLFFCWPKGQRQTLLFTCSRLPKRKTCIKQATQITRSLIATLLFTKGGHTGCVA